MNIDKERCDERQTLMACHTDHYEYAACTHLSNTSQHDNAVMQTSGETSIAICDIMPLTMSLKSVSQNVSPAMSDKGHSSQSAR